MIDVDKIKTKKDEEIEKLVANLRKNKLASSDSEARRMAEEMLSTSKKVSEDFAEREKRIFGEDKKSVEVELAQKRVAEISSNIARGKADVRIDVEGVDVTKPLKDIVKEQEEPIEREDDEIAVDVTPTREEEVSEEPAELEAEVEFEKPELEAEETEEGLEVPEPEVPETPEPEIPEAPEHHAGPEAPEPLEPESEDEIPEPPYPEEKEGFWVHEPEPIREVEPELEEDLEEKDEEPEEDIDESVLESEEPEPEEEPEEKPDYGDEGIEDQTVGEDEATEEPEESEPKEPSEEFGDEEEPDVKIKELDESDKPKKSDEQRKKEIEKMPESKVDLSKVFKSSK
ncbi:hypothetical protein AYK26_00230 [Euryarchaeota archaeon SM23-78]|nr:MAG: hypothetical protein AYK26_00230 [Euryarchaeota archaeon SM23-78]MBW3001389.1 hypothetical protein [Candidatus Woesearchaeota archaeon]